MSLFKKDNKTPTLHLLLNDKLSRAKHEEKNYFFYPLNKEEVSLAKKWCVKNKAYMEVDHQTDGIIFYKFKF